jgi:hypothetical protein
LPIGTGSVFVGTAQRTAGLKETQVMTEFAPRDLPLRWDVFVTPEVPIVDNDLPPGEKRRLWPPISSTLISGEQDAVLVDAFVTGVQTRKLSSSQYHA